MVRILPALFALIVGCLFIAEAEDTPAPAEKPTAPLQLDIETATHDQLLAEIRKLRLENRQLRSENQQLRRLLVKLPDHASDSSATSTNKISSAREDLEESEPEEIALELWLTGTSGKRHNNRCRYYRTTAGRSCGPDEGTPCKICGG